MGGANKGDETQRERKRKWKSICKKTSFSERQALPCQFPFWALSLRGEPGSAKHGFQSSSWEFVSNADSLAPPQTSRITKVGEGTRPSRFSQAFEWILTHWPKFEHHCCETSFQGSGCFQETARQLEGIYIYRGHPPPPFQSFSSSPNRQELTHQKPWSLARRETSVFWASSRKAKSLFPGPHTMPGGNKQIPDLSS